MWNAVDPAGKQNFPASGECSKVQGRWILAATILASSMAFIDSTVVNVALPALQSSMNASAVDLQWVIEAYALLLSAFVLTAGSLGDHYGRRRIFLFGVAIFTLASAGCGAARDIHQLIAARAIQGFGAALLIPGSLAIITTSFADEERGRAIGTWSGFSAITAAIGPVLGGWLIQHASWRVAFLMNVPIAVAVVMISLRHVPETADPRKRKVDWPGALLAACGLAALVFGLIESSRSGFGDFRVASALAAGAILLTLFIYIQAHVAEPMLPLSLFRSRPFTGANLLTFFLYGALSGALFFLPLNLIQIHHYSATAAGAALLPFILLMSFLSRWSGGLVTRYGSRPLLTIGPLLVAAAFVLFARPSVGGNYWQTFFPAVLVLGFGMAATVAPLTTTVMESVQADHAGLASGINNAVARSAGLLAIAVLGIVMLQQFRGSLKQRATQSGLTNQVSSNLLMQSDKLAATPIPQVNDENVNKVIRRALDDSFVSAFRMIMLIGAGMSIAAAGTAALFIDARRS